MTLGPAIPPPAPPERPEWSTYEKNPAMEIHRDTGYLRTKPIPLPPEPPRAHIDLDGLCGHF